MRKTENKRLFKPIEPPIHEDLNWDYNLIIRCLEVFRQILEERIHNLPKSTKFHLIEMTGKLGGKYPALGLSVDADEEMDAMPDFFELDDLVCKIYKEELPVDILKSRAENIKTISWEELQRIKFK